MSTIFKINSNSVQNGSLWRQSNNIDNCNAICGELVPPTAMKRKPSNPDEHFGRPWKKRKTTRPGGKEWLPEVIGGRSYPRSSLPQCDPNVLDYRNGDRMTYDCIGNSIKEVRFTGESPVLRLPPTNSPSSSTNTNTATSRTTLPKIEMPHILKFLGENAVSVKNKIGETADNRGVKHVDPDKPETFKVKQPGLVGLLYSGITCSNCAVRFPKEETAKYKEHLDWHFRQKQLLKSQKSRQYYYSLDDWLMYQEIDDEQEKPKSFFEIQNAKLIEKKEVPQPSVASKGFGMNPRCVVCTDKFEESFNQEEEEWQLMNAVCVREKLYHPLCFKNEK